MTYTIMVGVEGDPDRRAALRWAAERAARDGARLHLVYVIGHAWGDGTDEPGELLVGAAEALLATERRLAEQHVAAWAEGLGRRGAERGRTALETAAISVSTSYLYGHVGAELEAASQDADLLVVGTRSALEREGSYTGSLAVRVAAGALCPVAVIPHGWEQSGRGVTVGVDGGTAGELAVAFAADEAARLEEPLTIACSGYLANPLLAGLVPETSLGDRRQEIVAVAAEFARQLHPELQVVTRIIEAAPSRGLLTAAEGSRMLVVGTHNRHGMKRLMLGSVSHDILLNVHVPVVVVRSRR